MTRRNIKQRVALTGGTHEDCRTFAASKENLTNYPQNNPARTRVRFKRGTSIRFMRDGPSQSECEKWADKGSLSTPSAEKLSTYTPSDFIARSCKNLATLRGYPYCDED
ncbi:hypothetical protein ACJJTC_003840 [Scirpophaga incertulas]